MAQHQSGRKLIIETGDQSVKLLCSPSQLKEQIMVKIQDPS